MEHLYAHIFTRSNAIIDGPILLTEPFGTAKHPKERKQLAELMFERFQVPGLHLSLAPVLSLFSTARMTGLVLDSGKQTISLPVYEGQPLRHALMDFGVGASDLVYLLRKQLNEIGYCFQNPIADLPLALEMLETLCYTAPQRPILRDGETPPVIINPRYVDEMQKSLLGLKGTYLNTLPHELLPAITQFLFQQDAEYTLPDGQKITIGYPRYGTPEVLFTPELLEEEIQGGGIHTYVHNSIWRCDVDLRKDLCANVVLAGGNTLFPGTEIRLRNELQNLIPSTFSVNVISSQKYSAWIGGSILASLSTFAKMCVTKEQYKEHGERILRAMFL